MFFLRVELIVVFGALYMNMADSYAYLNAYFDVKVNVNPGLRLLQIGNLGLVLLWHILHLIVSIWYFLLDLAFVFESYLISGGVLKNYKALDLGKLKYLAIVIESEEAYQTSKVIELLQWLEAIGVKRVCLYDTEGNGAFLF